MQPSRNDIDVLIQLFAKLPGLGPRSARRAVLQLLTERDRVLKPLLQTLERTAESVRICHICANLDITDPCHICTDEKREQSVICVVEEVSDLWAMERSGLYKGTYHVLGGTLSALDGRGPQALRLGSLQTRVEKGNVQEVILATNATVDGQTTAHYITNLLKETGVKLSRLAQGIPIGGELDYLDDGTLGAALKARLPY